MLGHWTNFMITAAQASAALTGLVIVAISVNLGRILSFPHLPSRAGATVAALIVILVVAMAALVPQSLRALGAEVIFFGLCCWLLQVQAGSQMITARQALKRPWYEPVRGITFGQIQTVPIVIGGVLLAFSRPAGFYWIAGGDIAIFIFSTFNAWVLLVEILR